MLDFAEGVENRNYGLKKTGDLRTVREAMGIVLSFLVIAAAFSFHVWVRGRTIEIGYQKQQLSAQVDRLTQIEQQLILEEQTLKNPESLELFARNHLQMDLLRPSQIIPPPLEGWTEGIKQSLVSRSVFDASPKPKMHSSFNQID